MVVNIGGKQVSTSSSQPQSSIASSVSSYGTVVKTPFTPSTRKQLSGQWGFGSSSSPVQKIQPTTVTQQQLIAANKEATRQAELASRQQSLATNAAILGQERAAITSDQRKLDALTRKISEAAKKPFTPAPYFNKLILEQRRLAGKLETRAGKFDERVGEQNRLSKGLSEQFQLQEAKEMKKSDIDVKLSRTERGTLYGSFTSPETKRKRSIAEQRRISGTPLREQFGLEAAEATIVGSRIEKKTRERALSGEIKGLPGKVALQRETLAKFERKRPFESGRGVTALGLTPGERQAEPIVRESFEAFERPSRKKVKRLLESGDFPETLWTGGELTGRKFFEVGQRGETPKSLEFKRGVVKGTKEFFDLKRTPLGTDEFDLFAGTKEERQAKFGAAGRGITQLATLELAFGGLDIGLKFAKSGKGLKTFDIGQAGGIGAGKKKVLTLPEKAAIKAGDIKGTFTVKEPKLFVFSKPTKGSFIAKEPKVFTFAKPKSAIVTQKIPTFADELAGGLKSGAVPKIGTDFKKSVKAPKVFRFTAPTSQRGSLATITRPVEKVVTKPKTVSQFINLKEFGTTAGLTKKPQLEFKKFAGELTGVLKPTKKVEKDIGFFATSKISTAESIERGSIFKEIRIGEARVAATKRAGAIVKPVVKVKPAPFLSLEVPGSASALAVGLPRRPKGDFEEIAFTTTRTRVGEIPDLQKVQGVSLGLKTEPVSIRTTRRLFDTGFKTEPVSITGQKSFLDVGLRTDLGLKSEFVSLTKQRQELDTDLRLKQDTKIGTTSLTIPFQLSLTSDLTKQREDTAAIQRIVPISLAITRTRTSTRPITRPIVFPKLSTTTTVPTEKIKRPRVPFIPPIVLPRRAKPTETFGYQVFVRGKGKKTKKGFKSGEFIQATKGVLSRKEALAFGQSLVAGTAKRTFRLVPTVGKRAKVKRIPKFRPEMFRVKGRTFVEKSRFALDTSGEKREITAKGIATLKGFGLTSFTRVRKKRTIKRKKPKKKTKKRKKSKRR